MDCHGEKPGTGTPTSQKYSTRQTVPRLLTTADGHMLMITWMAMVSSWD